MKPATLNLAIADDHIMVRQSLARVLNSETSINVILEADNGKHLLQLLETTAVDVVLLDLRMPIMNGWQALKRIRNAYPKIKVIVLTGFEDTGFEREYLNAGALAFLSKSAEIDTIINTIHSVAQISSDYANSLLTKRETEILKRVIQKHSNTEIAKSLYLSIRTVENHRYNILRKTGSKTPEGLLNWIKKHFFSDFA